MACCAFALFVLSQLLAPFVGPWRRLFGEAKDRANRAVAWSPHAAGLAPRVAKGIRWRRGLYFAVGVEILAAVAIFDFVVLEGPSLTAADGSEWLGRDWCRAAGSILAAEK